METLHPCELQAQNLLIIRPFNCPWVWQARSVVCWCIYGMRRTSRESVGMKIQLTIPVSFDHLQALCQTDLEKAEVILLSLSCTCSRLRGWVLLSTDAFANSRVSQPRLKLENEPGWIVRTLHCSNQFGVPPYGFSPHWEQGIRCISFPDLRFDKRPTHSFTISRRVIVH